MAKFVLKFYVLTYNDNTVCGPSLFLCIVSAVVVFEKRLSNSIVDYHNITKWFGYLGHHRPSRMVYCPP